MRKTTKGKISLALGCILFCAIIYNFGGIYHVIGLIIISLFIFFIAYGFKNIEP